MFLKPHDELYRFIATYKKIHSNSPSYDEIMEATGKSRGSIQYGLDCLEREGRIRRIRGKRRNIEIVKPDRNGILIWGEIAAGYLSNPLTEVMDYLPFEAPWLQPKDFALRISGNSMIGDCIPDGAFVIMRMVPDGYIPKDGEIAAIFVAGSGLTLKHFYQKGYVVTLQASNPDYPSQTLDLRDRDVKVQATWLCTLHGKGWLVA